MLCSVSARRCIGRRCEYGDGRVSAESSGSSNCRAHITAAGVAAVILGRSLELDAWVTRWSLSSAASARASSAFWYAVSRSNSALLELSSLLRRRRTNCVIHLSLSISSMTKNRHHSEELSSSGSMSRIRSCEAARCLRAIDRGRLVMASTCRAPNPPFRICGVLYMAGRDLRLTGMMGNLRSEAVSRVSQSLLPKFSHCVMMRVAWVVQEFQYRIVRFKE